MYQQSLISKSKPILVEGVIILIIGLIVVGSHTQTDITFHDKYVLPIIAECYDSNQSTFCQDVRADHQVDKTAQLELGDAYWNELARQAIMSGVILFAVRMGLAFMIRKIRRIRITTVFVAVMWGVVASSLFLFGFLDTFYYLMQGEDVPQQLAWLDNAGIFTESKSWTGTPDHVEITDLILTNILGLVIIGSFWFVAILLYADSGLTNRSLA